jgi:hypothetical protein
MERVRRRRPVKGSRLARPRRDLSLGTQGLGGLGVGVGLGEHKTYAQGRFARAQRARVGGLPPLGRQAKRRAEMQCGRGGHQSSHGRRLPHHTSRIMQRTKSSMRQRAARITRIRQKVARCGGEAGRQGGYRATPQSSSSVDLNESVGVVIHCIHLIADQFAEGRAAQPVAGGLGELWSHPFADEHA